jgi:glycosyltransferase involved in cell wall biosynthesis
VLSQTRKPDEIVIEYDHEGLGASYTRHRGLRGATSEWVAFLDDDDEFGKEHLEKLERCAEETGADLVYPWFDVVGGGDPFPQHFGRPWDPADPVQTTISVLVRRVPALSVGGFRETWTDDEGVDRDGHRRGEDFRFVCRLNDAGYKIVHLPERTWRWHHWVDGDHIGNTSGLPWRERLGAA